MTAHTGYNHPAGRADVMDRLPDEMKTCTSLKANHYLVAGKQDLFLQRIAWREARTLAMCTGNGLVIESLN